MTTKIIAGKKYCPLVDIVSTNPDGGNSFYIHGGTNKYIFTVSSVANERVFFRYSINGKGDYFGDLPLTTFIHCVEEVEEVEEPTPISHAEATYEVVQHKEESKIVPGCTCPLTNVGMWTISCPVHKKEKPKEEWPKVGVDTANGIDRAVFWLSFDNSQFVFKSYDVLLEAIEKMKAIARELSGK